MSAFFYPPWGVVLNCESQDIGSANKLGELALNLVSMFNTKSLIGSIGNKLERSRFCQYPFVHKYNWIIMIIKQGVRVGESACGRLSHA
jgi:hypothetical protein